MFQIPDEYSQPNTAKKPLQLSNPTGRMNVNDMVDSAVNKTPVKLVATQPVGINNVIPIKPNRLETINANTKQDQALRSANAAIISRTTPDINQRSQADYAQRQANLNPTFYSGERDAQNRLIPDMSKGGLSLTPIENQWNGVRSGNGIQSHDDPNALPVKRQAGASTVAGITKTVDENGRVTYSGKGNSQGSPIQLSSVGDNRSQLDKNLDYTGNPVTDELIGAARRGLISYDALPQLANAYESGRQTGVAAQNNLAEQNSPERKLQELKFNMINNASNAEKKKAFSMNGDPMNIDQLEAIAVSQLSNPERIKYFQNKTNKNKRFVEGEYGKLFDTETGLYIDQQ